MGVLILCSLLLSFLVTGSATPGQWSTCTDNNFGWIGASSFLYQDTIYLIGGKKNGAYNKQILLFAEQTKGSGNFTFLRSIDIDEQVKVGQFHTWTCMNGIGILTGGVTETEVLGSMYKYDISANQWTPIGSGDQLCAYWKHTAAASADGNLLLIYGGYTTIDDTTPSSAVLICSKDKDFVPTVVYPELDIIFPPPISSCLTFWKTDSENNISYFILSGGRDSAKTIRPSLWLFKVDLNSSVQTVKVDRMFIYPEGFLPREGHSAFLMGSSLILFGGTLASSQIAKVNLKDMTWYTVETRSAQMPPPLAHFAWVYSSNSTPPALVVLGGEKTDTATGDVTASEAEWSYPLDVCYSHDSCTDCTEADGCSWCATKHSCVSANVGVVLYEMCSQLFNYHQACVEECATRTNCLDCALSNGCGWCQHVYASPESFPACLPGSALGPSLGTCQSWVYIEHAHTPGPANDAESQCKAVTPTLTVTQPPADQPLVPGDKIEMQWTFAPAEFGYVDVYYTLDGQEEVLIGADVETQAGWLLFTVPQLNTTTPAAGDANANKLTFVFYLHSTGSAARIPFKSSEYDVQSPKFSFSSPTEGQVIAQDANVSIKFTKDIYTKPLDIFLRREDDPSASLHAVKEFTDETEMSMNMTGLPGGTDYVVLLAHPYDSNFVFAKSPRFTYDVKNIQLELISPKPDEHDPHPTIQAGEEVQIEWNCGTDAGSMSVSLYRTDSKGELERVVLIQQAAPPHEVVKWEAMVPEESSSYVFVVEELVTHINVTSKPFTIIPPLLDATLSGSKGADAVIEYEKVEISWTYHGKPCEKELWLVDAASKKNVSWIATVSADRSSFTWEVPGSVDATLNYYILVHADWFNMTATTAPFVIAKPGGVPVKSLGSAVTLVVLSAVMVIVLLVIYCLKLKNFKTGFNPIH